MIKSIWKYINWGSRWIAVGNGIILSIVGVALVALGDNPAWLLLNALGAFALFVGIRRPQYWATKDSRK